MGNDLGHIENLLEMLYEQQKEAEKQEITTQNPVDRIQCKQQIRQIKAKIQEREREYLELLSQNSDDFIATETEAAIQIITAEIERVQAQPDSYPQQILDCLQRIEAKLNEPGSSAAAKLKGSLSLMPPFVNLSYEGELDTENFFRKNFPTFRKLIPGAKK